MSPASSGNLEVEKYIGACLISQQRPKGANNRDVFFATTTRLPEVYPGSYVNFDGRFRIQRCGNSADRWAGGMPLISFANHQKRNRPTEIRCNSPKSEEQHTPLSRLAVHTQGAPLILTKTFNRRNKAQKKAAENKNKAAKSGADNQNGAVDTVSVTSDESSGSANSDNCLPRIIKPRKRRKKDRKPSLTRALNQDGFSTDSASPDIDTIPILRSFTPFIFDPHIYGLVPEGLPLNTKPVNDESETPKLHHSFEDVEELDDVDINGNQTVCQCRYCDPAGQIWDVDRNCYSPFLTAPRKTFEFTNFESFLSNYGSMNDSEHNCLVHSMSSISLEEEKEKNDAKSLPSSSGDLEVSTEIVTSLNGHRDIEIKFFSSSASADSVRAALPKSPDRILNNVDDKLCARRLCENDPSVNNKCKFVSEE